MTTEVRAWERQDNEPDEAWSAFRNFRDMLPPRRIRSAAPKDSSILQRWASEWRWRERALAYDRHIDAQVVEERASVLKQNEEHRVAKQLSILLDAEDLAGSELRKLLAAASQGEGVGLLKPSDVVKILETSIKYQRLIRGEATERVETAQDLSRLSIQELELLKALEEKIKPQE